VRGALAYDVAKGSATGKVVLNKPINGSDLQLTATYKQAGDEFVLEESWRFDDRNRLAGAYNFATEEATFAYTHTRGPWSATSRYNFQKDATVLEVARRQGKATLGAAYAVQDQTATLTWAEKPLRAQLKAKVGGGGVTAAQATLTLTHEFDL
jgi:hypothetical protein